MTMTTTVKASKKGYITIILTALCFVVLMLSLPCRAFAFTGYYVNVNGEIVDTYRDGGFFVEETTHRACMENGRLAAAESHWASMDDSSTCTICHAKDIVAQNLFDDIFHYYSYESMKETACFTGCHYALCTEADTCTQCKQQNVTMESVLHNVEQENNGYDYDHHWTYCINCGETIYEGEHYAYCTNPDICFGCGHGNVDIKSINHCLDYSSLRFDETGHWYECSDCTEKVGYQPHTATCDNRYSCLTCDYHGIIANVFHNYNYTDYQHDDYYHWLACSSCGEQQAIQSHQADHSQPTECTICHATGLDSNAFVHNYVYANNTYQHWYVCSECGYSYGATAHEANCDTPDKCKICDATDIYCPWVNHDDWSNLTRIIHPDSHAYFCHRCNQEFANYPHTAMCGKPSTCRECGATNIVPVQTYHEKTEYSYNTTEHWEVCSLCDSIINKSNHSISCAEPTICMICGASGITGTEYYWGTHTYIDCYDEMSHWSECTVCGSIADRQSHYQYCDAADTETCAFCGHTDVEVAKVYHQNEIMLVDKTGHYYMCLTCNKSSWDSCHFDLDNCAGIKCNQCGMTEDEAEIFGDHQYAPMNTYDRYGHWYQCISCGVHQRFKHVSQCNQPTICTECGITGDDNLYQIQHSYSSYINQSGQWFCQVCNTEHIHDFFCDYNGYCRICGIHISQVEEAVQTHSSGVYHSDNTHHWYACHVCTRIVTREVHHYVDGICPTCGKTTDSLPVYSAGQTLMLPADLTTIADEAFTYNAAHYIIIPAGCVSIGASAFANCTQLESVSLPASVSFIADDAFAGIDHLLISAPAGSYAASWTINHGYTLIEH